MFQLLVIHQPQGAKRARFTAARSKQFRVEMVFLAPLQDSWGILQKKPHLVA